jgi:hypothetical protein
MLLLPGGYLRATLMPWYTVNVENQTFAYTGSSEPFWGKKAERHRKPELKSVHVSVYTKPMKNACLKYAGH